jgi:undecaprenyl-diphosphatase
MDSAIVKWLNAGVGELTWWDAFMRAVVSDYLVPVLGSLLLLGFWFSKRGEARVRNQMITLAGAIAVGFANLATSAVNNAYFRARPYVDHDLNLLFYQPTDSSFPSNAAGLGFAIATVVFIGHRWLGVAMVSVAVVYGCARVYAGIHYPSDVLAGAAIGAAMAGAAWGVVWLFAPLARVLLRAGRLVYIA